MKRARKTSAPRPGRLFAEPERPGTSAGALTANIDGAARGNPGPAAYGVVVRGPDGRPLEELSKCIGRATNNVAEYYALIAALDYAAAHGIRKLRVRSDSELLVRQMQGRYKVKSLDLRPLHERARKLSQGLAFFSIDYVPREQNLDADCLANLALDQHGSNASRPKFFSGKLLTAEDLEAEQEFHRGKTQGSRIRATYRAGALHPAEPLDLPEGAEVEILIGKPQRR